MKFKLIVTSILALLALNACFATSVELNSSSLSIENGDTFSLDLLIKDAPETWAFENANLNYDKNILNLTSITLSEVSSSGMADKRVSDGFISILWMSSQPTGNFTIATLSFETLSRGNTQITLNPTLADSEGEVDINVTNTDVSVYEILPDLVITNVSIDPLKKYETNTVLVTVLNNGTLNTSAFNVSLEAVTGVIDSDVEESVAGLNIGESTVVMFENITLGPNNLFDIYVDSEYAIEESDETNNEISFGNQPSENAISAVLSCENDSVKTGETFNVTFSLNDLTANRPAKAVEGELVFDSSVLSCTNFKFQLNASEANETYLENVTIGSGVVTFSIVDGTIDENTTIAIATFEALAVGNSDILLENLVVSDVNGYAFNNVSETETNMIVQGPDVSVENVEVSNPYYMEPAIIKVTVANNGHQTVESCDVNVYIDSDELAPLTVTDLGVGESKIVEFNWTPQKSKTFTVVTVLDSSDAISEENENNNQNTTHYTVSENAISAVLSCENDSVKTGETFNVTFSLNDLTANRPAKAVEGELVFDSSVLSCTNFEFQLNASEANETYLENVTIGSGVVTFSIVDGTIDENTTIAIATFEALRAGSPVISLENLAVSDLNGYAFNNVSTENTGIIVEGPDVKVESVEILDAYYMEPAVIKVNVSNIGHQAVNSSTVKIYIDSDELDPLTVTELGINESKIVEFNWTPQKSKTFTITTVLDYLDEIGEENENNNQNTTHYTVSENAISAVLSSDKETVGTKETFNVTFSLNDLTANRPAKAVEGELVFSSSVLTCTNFKFQLNASEANETYLENVTIGSGVVTFSIVDGTIDENTTIAIATFEAVDIGNPVISLENLAVSDLNGYAFNNVNETDVNVTVYGRPDVKVENIEVSNPYYMEPAVIKVNVSNIGHESVDSCTINVSVDVDKLAPLTVTDLGVGESKIVEFNWTPQESKPFTITTVLDYLDEIGEENETNNQYTENVTITERLIYIEIYKKSETENQTIASVKLSGIVEERQCNNYSVYLSLDNLEAVEINAIGETTNWSVTNNTLFITGYEFTEYGEFEIANITFNRTNNSISAIISECALSDVNGYAFNEIFTSNKILNLNSIENIVVGSDVSELVNESALETANNGKFNVTKIYFDNGDSIWIPEVVENISITNETLDAMNEAISNLGNIDFDSITSEDDANDIMDEVIANMVVVSNYGFDVSNITQETVTDGTNAVSELRFTATNTSSKGFLILRLPVGELEISEIIVNNGTANISLEKDDIESTIGWYRTPVDGILEITLIKDPEVTIKFVSALPQSTSSSSSRSGGGSSYSADIADDIESKVLKNFVSSASVIYGNEIDMGYATQLRERVTNASGFTIYGNTIIVGGPEVNAFAREYNSQFEIPISNDVPGENRGIIQVMTIQDNSGTVIKSYTIVYIAGSDRFGTLSALEYFKTLDELPEWPITVEWTQSGPVLV
ncbi:CARDB domain-containing protein [Methanococcus sp. CF]